MCVICIHVSLHISASLAIIHKSLVYPPFIDIWYEESVDMRELVRNS